MATSLYKDECLGWYLTDNIKNKVTAHIFTPKKELLFQNPREKWSLAFWLYVSLQCTDVMSYMIKLGSWAWPEISWSLQVWSRFGYCKFVQPWFLGQVFEVRIAYEWHGPLVGFICNSMGPCKGNFAHMVWKMSFWRKKWANLCILGIWKRRFFHCHFIRA